LKIARARTGVANLFCLGFSSLSKTITAHVQHWYSKNQIAQELFSFL